MRIFVQVHSVDSPGDLAGLREENALLTGALDGFDRLRVAFMRRSVGRPLSRTWWCAAVALLALGGCASASSPSPSGTSGGVTGGDFHSLVADPTTVGRIYVGGHTNVSRSDDGGKTWMAVAALDGADAMGWTIEPGTIWVSGHPGLNLSVDGGITFTRRNAGLADSDVHAFGSSGQTLYAAGPGLGVAGSIDGGVTWTTLTSASGQSFFGRILVDPVDPAHLVAADVQFGANASTDGGRTWTPLGSNAASWVSSPDGLATLFASGGPIPQRSNDGGNTWTPMSVPAGATLVEASPAGTLYAGVHDGNAVTVWASTDDGATWNSP